MDPTTQALLKAISEANDNNEFTSRECWVAIADRVFDWRQAGKPDLEALDALLSAGEDR